MLPDFLHYHEDGYDIVYGERVNRTEHFLLRMVRKLFYRFTRTLADETFILDMAEFSLISADVREAILQDNNSYPFLRASIGRVGFQRKGIPYKRERRVAGETHYNIISMTIFAIAGILSSTTIFLRAPVYLFPVWLLLNLGLIVSEIVQPNNWAIPLIIFLGFTYCGATLCAISIYVTRTYKNGLHRPNYYIDKKHTMLQSTPIRDVKG